MGQTFKPDDISDILADMNRRLENLETGGKAIVGTSTGATGSMTLPNLDAWTPTVTLSWTDSTVQEPIMAIPYTTLYVDNNNDSTYVYGKGTNVDHFDHLVYYHLEEEFLLTDPYKTRLRFFIQNTSGGSHTYYLYIKWLYVTGSSSSS